MKHFALFLCLLAIPSFAFTVHSVEKETLAGVILYMTVRRDDSVCLMDYNLTTQTVLFQICFSNTK